VKLLSWNIQWCRGMDGSVDPERTARVARELHDPDVLCLQEVAVNFAGLAGSAGEDQAALLAQAFPGYEAHFAWGVDAPAEGGGRQRFGNMLLSRLPVRQVLRHSLPWPAHAQVPSMPRVLLEAVIEGPWGPVRVATMHLEYYSAPQRAAQVERLRELHEEACAHARAGPSALYASGPFRHLPRPAAAILAGDFNFTPEDPLYARLLAPFGGGAPRYVDAWLHAHPAAPRPATFHLHDPSFAGTPYCCDFVLVTEDLAPHIVSVHVDLDTQASDHQPLAVELR
jgi:endonuclease/exonuclease/phosphatase family metal-dependent hydrolase